MLATAQLFITVVLSKVLLDTLSKDKVQLLL
jgi:hypothetical protein